MDRFDELTLELLRHKYAYYVLCQPMISDYKYDMLEREWQQLGRELGVDMDNYDHWVDFDEQHPLAAKAKEYFRRR